MVSFQRIRDVFGLAPVFRRSKALSTKAQELLEAKPSLWQWRLVLQVLDDELAAADEWMEATTQDVSVQSEESDSDPEDLQGRLNALIASSDASLAEVDELENVARQMGLKGDLFYPEMVEAWSKWMTAQLATERNKLEEIMAGFDIGKAFDHDESRAIIEFAQLVGQSYRRLLQLELQRREPREPGLYSRVRELWASAIRRGAIADIQTCCSELAQQVEILVDGKGYRQPDPQINFARTYPENDIPNLLESIQLEEVARAQAELADLERQEDDQGYIYLLTNQSMPGLVKVGKTTRDPSERMKELSSATGVPTPFELILDLPMDDCDAAEEYVHDALEARGCRVSEGREFFEVPVNDAIKVMLEAKNW